MACVGRTLLSDAFDLMRISVGGAILENPERHCSETAQQTLFSGFGKRKRAQSAVSHRSVINILRPRAHYPRALPKRRRSAHSTRTLIAPNDAGLLYRGMVFPKRTGRI